MLVFIEHGTRRMHIGGVTANPAGEWTVQQARNLGLGLGERFEDIKFLIRDRGSNFTASFDAIFQAAGTRIIRTAVQAPRMNAICGHFRYAAPRAPRSHANSRRVASARRPGRVSGALEHGSAAPGNRPAHPDGEHHGDHLTVPTSITNGSTENPSWRPDQRILTRRLTPRRLAGQHTDPIFERDSLGGAAGRSTRRAVGPASQAIADLAAQT